MGSIEAGKLSLPPAQFAHMTALKARWNVSHWKISVRRQEKFHYLIEFYRLRRIVHRNLTVLWCYRGKLQRTFNRATSFSWRSTINIWCHRRKRTKATIKRNALILISHSLRSLKASVCFHAFDGCAGSTTTMLPYIKSHDSDTRTAISPKANFWTLHL